MKICRSFVLLCCLCAGAAGLHAQELHPKLQSGERQLRSVLILPPGIAVVRQGLLGTQILGEQTTTVTARLAAALAQELAAKGIKVLPNPFSPEALLQDQQLQYELTDLQARYDLLAPLLHQDAQALRRGEFSLGKEVAGLKRDSEADAFVLVRAYGTDPTLAKTAYALLVPFGGAPTAKLYLSLALLDAQSGEVLCLARQVVSGNLFKDEQADKRLAKALAQALKKLPASK